MFRQETTSLNDVTFLDLVLICPNAGSKRQHVGNQQLPATRVTRGVTHWKTFLLVMEASACMKSSNRRVAHLFYASRTLLSDACNMSVKSTRWVLPRMLTCYICRMQLKCLSTPQFVSVSSHFAIWPCQNPGTLGIVTDHLGPPAPLPEALQGPRSHLWQRNRSWEGGKSHREIRIWKVNHLNTSK